MRAGAMDNTAILSNVLQASREHYCIHPTVSKKTNKDEECQNLLKDDPGCKFFKNVHKLYSMQSSHFLLVCCHTALADHSPARHLHGIYMASLSRHFAYLP